MLCAAVLAAAAASRSRAALDEEHFAPEEVEAIRTLRRIAEAERRFRARLAVDVDGDGVGEYGTLRELAGALAVRTAADGDNAGGQPLATPLLPPAFASLGKDGAARHAGYRFALLLPGTAWQGVGEQPRAPDDTLDGVVDTDGAEAVWGCYAWPEGPARGLRTFFAHARGDVVATRADVTRDAGRLGPENAGSAFRMDERPLDALSGAVAVGVQARDGHRWHIVFGVPGEDRTARSVANEAAVVAEMRRIHEAQREFQARVAVDLDRNGVGEFGMFQELSGSTWVRNYTTGENYGGVKLAEPLLAPEFGCVVVSSPDYYTYRVGPVRHGYRFNMFLPGPYGDGVAESATPRGDDVINGTLSYELAEAYWACYAVPAEVGTGRRTYFVNQDGIVTTRMSGRWVDDAHGFDLTRPGAWGRQSLRRAGVAPSESGSAFTPTGAGVTYITGEIAVGATGRDGGRWERVNGPEAPLGRAVVRARGRCRETEPSRWSPVFWRATAESRDGAPPDRMTVDVSFRRGARHCGGRESPLPFRLELGAGQRVTWDSESTTAPGPYWGTTRGTWFRPASRCYVELEPPLTEDVSAVVGSAADGSSAARWLRFSYAGRPVATAQLPTLPGLGGRGFPGFSADRVMTAGLLPLDAEAPWYGAIELSLRQRGRRSQEFLRVGAVDLFPDDGPFHVVATREDGREVAFGRLDANGVLVRSTLRGRRIPGGGWAELVGARIEVRGGDGAPLLAGRVPDSR